MSESRSVVSDSLLPHGLSSPGQNTGVGGRSLLQGIFPTQGSKPGLPHCHQISYQVSHQGSLSHLLFYVPNNVVLKYIKQNLLEFQREIEKAQWTKSQRSQILED